MPGAAYVGSSKGNGGFGAGEMRVCVSCGVNVHGQKRELENHFREVHNLKGQHKRPGLHSVQLELFVRDQYLKENGG